VVVVVVEEEVVVIAAAAEEEEDGARTPRVVSRLLTFHSQGIAGQVEYIVYCSLEVNGIYC